MKNGNRQVVVAYLPDELHKRLERQRAEHEQETGIKPSMSQFVGALIRRSLSGQSAQAS